MNMLSFGPRRKKRFVILILVFFSVPMLALILPRDVKLILFLPLLLWVNIGGLPLAMIGVPYIELHEFGADPQGAIGYALIALVYLMAALFFSLIGKAEENNSNHDA